MLIVAFLPVTPASASQKALNIDIYEKITRMDVYEPSGLTNGVGTYTNGTVNGTGVVKITNTNPSGITLSDVYVYLANGNTLSSSWALDTTPGTNKITSNVGVSSDGTTVTIHIPEIKSNEFVNVTYTISNDAIHAPLYMNVSYVDNKLAAYVGANTTISLTVARDDTNVPAGDTITNIKATFHSGDYDSDSTDDFTFNTTTLSFANKALGESETKQAIATINDADAFEHIPDTVYLVTLSNTTLEYTISSTTRSVSGVKVNDVDGKTSNIITDLTKQLSGGRWRFTPRVNITSGDSLSYELSSVTMWVTRNDNLNTIVDQTTNTMGGSPGLPATLTGGNVWTGNTWILGEFSGIPAGFLKPSINLTYDTTQFPSSYTTNNGTMTILKKIWIVNGYLVQVNKTVTPTATSGVYDISIKVTNVGSDSTPDVIVYDIVSNKFSITSGPTPAANGTTSVSVQGLTGTAYWWDVGTLTSGETKTITYTVTGSGEYPLTDLYLVGVDPAQSFNMQSTPSLTNESILASANFESLAAMGAACLLIVGMIGTARRRL